VCSQCRRDRQQLRRGLCHACYERARRSGDIRSNLVDATPAKAKIAELVAAGWGQRRIAKQAGVSRSMLMWIMRGRTTIAAKTCDAICALEAEPDPAAIAHRALCEAGMRGDYVSPQRKYRHARAAREKWVKKWIAEELDVEELAAERRTERRLPFPELYAELRYHCGLADWEIAKRLGVLDMSLLRRLESHGIKPTPEFVTMCCDLRREQRKAAQCA
jgi:transcriptional regulator with XRE-family HTH domain